VVEVASTGDTVMKQCYFESPKVEYSRIAGVAF
jgi:hypothetical protein